MNTQSQIKHVEINQNQNRILSIDFFRGLIMFILVTGIAELFGELTRNGKGNVIFIISILSGRTLILNLQDPISDPVRN